MTAEAGGGERRGIGVRLRAARERRGLTLLQAAERLHVDARTLEALESEDFTALGAEVYVRGHLRRYAEAVGESSAELQELYGERRNPSPPDLTRIPRGEPENRGSRLLLPAMLLVVALAVAGLLWWLLTLPGEKAHPLPAGHAPVNATVSDGAADGAPAGAAAGAAAASEAPPIAAPSPGPSATAPQARLDLSFSGPSWVEVTDAEHRSLLHGLIERGGTRAVTGRAPLTVVLGNAAAVALRLNGQPLPAEAVVRRDGSAHLLIDADGRVSAAAARLAHGD
ncbi:MAG: helix-turn-helix domain-containing protein [Gammaproteobacteria bacterium]|nr:helix-turn-helix domain-containing protein [Gammaproteobacteria bacterium]